MDLFEGSGDSIVSLRFTRPAYGPTVALEHFSWPICEAPAWRSNGGPTRGHPARSFPFTLEAELDEPGALKRLHLLGVFAEFAGAEHEVAGTMGASLQLLLDDNLVYRHELLNGRHYSDAGKLDDLGGFLGDGTSRSPVGTADSEGERLRVDLLSIDVPADVQADTLKFKTLSSPASFTIYDIYAEPLEPHGCPFHSGGGGVPLARIGSIVRVGDRVGFAKAVTLLEHALTHTKDLDEARGQALTFLAVLTAAVLETGGSRSLLREQLQAARELERASDPSQVVASTLARIERLAAPLYKESLGPTDRLVDRALQYVERNYAKALSDSAVAQHLGLSTSHFRFLFRQATGQPFHKYLNSVRLEKARQMLMAEGAQPVSTVAKAVGFIGLSHFSRAFTQRFNVTPTSVRRGG